MKSSNLENNSQQTQRVFSLVQRLLCFRRLDVVKQGVDISLIIIAALWAWVVSFGQLSAPGSPWPFVSAVVTARLGLYFLFGVHRTSWVHVSRYEVARIAWSAALGIPAIGLLLWALPTPFSVDALQRPLLLITTEPVFYLLLLFSIRITARAIASSSRSTNSRRILVVGAGNAAHALTFQIQEGQTPFHIIGFLDDDARKQGRRYRGVPVLGAISELAEIAREYEVQEVVVAITNFAPSRLREVLADAETCEMPVRILPPLAELLGGKPDVRSLREVRMEDLLPRAEITQDRSIATFYLANRTVLITGGGGSIGGELCRQAIAAGARQVLVLGRGENSVFEMVQELKEQLSLCEITPVICDVRDRSSLERIFERYSPQVVFHAAAHKHVPLMEQYPCEAVKNNVVGTLNVVELSVKHGVERFVMVSTDKAVDPSSVMGATKRLGEMIVKGYAAHTGRNMVSVRFGNVLGSRGSVVPTMKRQIRDGKPITITDPEMVRYFMTIPEAVQLILQAGAVGEGGEVFILDMGRPVKILDLAHDLIRLSGLVPDVDIKINIVGRRPGEKLREELLTSHEENMAEKRGPFFVAPPETVDLRQLLPQIEQLRDSSGVEDSVRTLQLLKNLVPNFHPEQLTLGENGGLSKISSQEGTKRLPLAVLHVPEAHGQMNGSHSTHGAH